MEKWTYEDDTGDKSTWVEEVRVTGRRWRLWCKICRWHGAENQLAKGQAKSWLSSSYHQLRRRGNSTQHARAQASLLKSNVVGGKSLEQAEDRRDVPCLGLCLTAYKNAQSGKSYRSYEKDVATTRSCGAPIPQSRGSQFVARKIVEASSAVLCDEDRQLLGHCTDVSLSMDKRGVDYSMYMRLVLGDGWPPNLRAQGKSCAHGDEETDGEGSATPPATSTEAREIMGAHGK